MLKTSKILAMFLAVGSLAFLGFAVAVTFGGPDWKAQLNQPYFSEYTVSRTLGENPTWVAVRTADGREVGKNISLAPVIAKVQADAKTQLDSRISKISERESALQGRITVLKAALESDKKALADYETDLRNRLKQIRDESSALATQVLAQSAEAQKLETTIALRRDEVFQLQQLIEEFRADIFRIETLQGQLDNTLIQVQGDLARARERSTLLSQQ